VSARDGLVRSGAGAGTGHRRALGPPSGRRGGWASV